MVIIIHNIDANMQDVCVCVRERERERYLKMLYVKFNLEMYERPPPRVILWTDFSYGGLSQGICKA